MKPSFLNRNPRNLEQMALALKDRGWRTTWPSQKFYHRCGYLCARSYLDRCTLTPLAFSPSSLQLSSLASPPLPPFPSGWCSQHHVTAEVFANSDPVPVLLCSTKECALKCELAASQAVGEVLAQRCL
uniref:Uncharacterized protein n=1 Tax=Oncorhynchus tshawytscha TaxID=74940 RepID=A0AAZ3PMR6_ONCTS